MIGIGVCLSGIFATFVTVQKKIIRDMKRRIGHAAWVSGAAAVLMAVAALVIIGQKNDCIDVVIGTYGQNVYVYSFDCKTLEFKQKSVFAATDASYALTDGGNLYAVREKGDDSGVYSFVGDDAVATEKRQTGADPCFVLMHDGFMMTADYSGGTVSVFPVMADGSVGDRCGQLAFYGSGVVEGRQESSHIHQLKVLPGNASIILAADLGADKIHVIQMDKCEDACKLSHICDIDCPAGSGPRHMEFAKDGKTLYCMAELSGEVLVYDICNEGNPKFDLIQIIMADDVNAGGSADIHMHPDGKYLYTSHRLENDGISVFKVNDDATLTKVSYTNTARHPRNFMITPDGNHVLVACRDDKVVQVFEVNENHSLTLTESVLEFTSDMPSSVLPADI